MTLSRPRGTGNDRFRRRDGRRILLGLFASLALHVMVFVALPTLDPSRVRRSSPEMQIVPLPTAVTEPPPRVALPEPPAPVPRPTPPSPEARRDSTPSLNRPTFIPHDVPPRLLNRPEVESMLLDLYPEGLNVLDVGGAVILWLYVDPSGRVLRTVLREPSQFEGFNRAAEAVARAMRFRPARRAGNPVAVWVQQRIRFRPLDPASGGRGGETGGPGRP